MFTRPPHDRRSAAQRVPFTARSLVTTVTVSRRSVTPRAWDRCYGRTHMWFHVLACDYDGTLATGGRVPPAVFDAVRRTRESGRRVVLVTGRALDDLLTILPEIDAFDLVVA